MNLKSFDDMFNVIEVLESLYGYYQDNELRYCINRLKGVIHNEREFDKHEYQNVQKQIGELLSNMVRNE